MWIDDLPTGTSWTSLWSGFIRCGECSGIRSFDEPCPACGAILRQDVGRTIRVDNGQEVDVAVAHMGAEARYEDYIYLQRMEREWKRMVDDSASMDRMPHTTGISAGASIVLLFWTYFETRVTHLLRDALQDIPSRFVDDALKRYTIAARMKRFYKIAFGTTYYSDLKSLDYSDVSDHLERVRRRRNDFVHGTPESIDDSLVKAVVALLKRKHESWIAVYNLRASKNSMNRSQS